MSTPFSTKITKSTPISTKATKSTPISTEITKSTPIWTISTETTKSTPISTKTTKSIPTIASADSKSASHGRNMGGRKLTTEPHCDATRKNSEHASFFESEVKKDPLQKRFP